MTQHKSFPFLKYKSLNWLKWRTKWASYFTFKISIKIKLDLKKRAIAFPKNPHSEKSADHKHFSLKFDKAASFSQNASSYHKPCPA